MFVLTSSMTALLLSLAINAIQFAESFYKEHNAHDIKEQQIKAETDEKAAQRQHELKKIELNENIYRAHQTIPEARKVCLEYIGATETEMTNQPGLPVIFSLQQKSLETKVILYLPGARQEIENFKISNVPGLGGGHKELESEFRNIVIPAIANELESFQLEKQ